MGKIAIITIIILTVGNNVMLCQRVTNHAVLIGVDTYKHSTTWNSPPQLKKNIEEMVRFFTTSEKYHFKLTSLINRDVYVDNIRRTLQNLAVSAGDHVMIYMTGHGCQVEDKSEKKKNAMHQGFICYDTPDKSSNEFSKTVLLGDSLGVWLTNLRRKVGSGGQVFILAESCYSGLITRGGPKKGIFKNKQTQFIEENIGNLKELAPLVVFSSSRAFNQTSSLQKFTLIFLSEFKKFSQGSYFDLFGKFYQAQRKEVLQKSDIQLSVNLDVDDPGYLRMGFFQDSIYAPNNFIRIVDVSPDYDTDHLFQIDRGVFEGVTQGSTVKMTDEKRKVFFGKVEIAKNGSSWVFLTDTLVPLKTDLWKCQVQMDHYNFQDTLFVAIDDLMADSTRQQVKAKLADLKFIKFETAASSKNYSIKSIKDSLFIVRNKDTAIICKMPHVADLKSTVLKIEISHFIKQLNTSKDSTVNLLLQLNKAPLSDNDLFHLKPNDSVVITIQSTASNKERYYCLLHLRDEFISQIVPVHFQVNESECKLPRGLNKDILIGGVKIGKGDGSFLLITSETPFDLRQALLTPLSRSRGKPNKIERIIQDLFLNDTGMKPLYNPEALKIEQRKYKIESAE